MDVEIHIELTRDEFELLLIALGYATSRAIQEHDHGQMVRFLRLANSVNKNNPSWKAYEIPEE